MSNESASALRKYLRELRKELNCLAVTAADDAISDASEFLQSEIVATQDSWHGSSEAEFYSRFVELYGAPRMVALGYVEASDFEGSDVSTCRHWRALARQNHWKRAVAAMLILTGTVALCVAGYLQEPPKLSPFTEVRFEERDAVVVHISGQIYRLIAIDEIPTRDILQSARDNFGELWQKRFAEDLVEVLWAMGHRPGATVRLDLRNQETNETVTIDEAAMTEANRRQVWQARVAVEAQKNALAAGDLQKPPKLSPFTEVRYDDDGVIVRVHGQLYRLIAFDDIPSETILQSARDQFGTLWQKRFAEDLVEVLWAMGHLPGASVKLELQDLKSKEAKTIDHAPMTEDNRREVRRARHAPQQSVMLDSQRAAALLDDFQAILRQRWSYYFFSASEIEAEIASLSKRIVEPISTSQLALEFQKIIALGIDGHAEVSAWRLENGFLPFLIEPLDGRYVAFHPDRSALLSAEHPYIVSIDGRPLEEWLRAAAAVVPKGSDGYVKRHTLRFLRNIQHWRAALGLPKTDWLSVELASADGNQTKTVRLLIADRLPMYGIWPQSASRILEEDIGYLRLPAMNDAAIDEIRRMMPRFRDTSGLIIDVRDNGGGSREPLRWIDSYLADDDNPPRVVNCAKYRLFDGFPEDQLAARFMYTARSSQWSDQEREAIARFQESFAPERDPPHDEFSAWHYMVLDRQYDEDTYHYAKPVVVLMNAKCFSATDIFLAALKEHNNVTLIGTSSGGGSARVELADINGSGIRVALGSMVSYMPNGQLFDGHGVDPDIIVHPCPEDFVGRGDTLLDRAVEQIRAHEAKHPAPTARGAPAID